MSLGTHTWEEKGPEQTGAEEEGPYRAQQGPGRPLTQGLWTRAPTARKCLHLRA